MQGKDLQRRSCQLMRYYRYANRMAFNTVPNVIKHLDRFTEFERKLINNHIFPRNYAFTVIHMLRGWVKSKKFTYLPVNVFLGTWAYGKYMKQYESQYATIVWDDEQKARLLYDELNVARYYISAGGELRFSKVVHELRPLLSDEWYTCYRNKQRPVGQALDVLCYEYNVPFASDYDDIITLQV